MKKVTLILAALVMGFLVSSCTNKKDEVIKVFNTFFDSEMAALDSIDSPDACLDYYNGYEDRFNEFYAMLDKDFPIDENDEFIGFSKEDSDAAMDVYVTRINEWNEKLNTKCKDYYEPYISKLETLVYNLDEDMENGYEPTDEDIDNILSAYEDTDKYVDLASSYQYDRYEAIDQMVQEMFGLDEIEE